MRVRLTFEDPLPPYRCWYEIPSSCSTVRDLQKVIRKGFELDKVCKTTRLDLDGFFLLPASTIAGSLRDGDMLQVMIRKKCDYLPPRSLPAAGGKRQRDDIEASTGPQRKRQKQRKNKKLGPVGQQATGQAKTGQPVVSTTNITAGSQKQGSNNDNKRQNNTPSKKNNQPAKKNIPSPTKNNKTAKKGVQPAKDDQPAKKNKQSTQTKGQASKNGPSKTSQLTKNKNHGGNMQARKGPPSLPAKQSSANGTSKKSQKVATFEAQEHESDSSSSSSDSSDTESSSDSSSSSSDESDTTESNPSEVDTDSASESDSNSKGTSKKSSVPVPPGTGSLQTKMRNNRRKRKREFAALAQMTQESISSSVLPHGEGTKTMTLPVTTTFSKPQLQSTGMKDSHSPPKIVMTTVELEDRDLVSKKHSATPITRITRSSTSRNNKDALEKSPLVHVHTNEGDGHTGLLAVVRQDRQDDDELDFDAPPRDYEALHKLDGYPEVGDVIAYKTLEMSPDYTPVISDFKEARVLKFSEADMTAEVQLARKFRMPVEVDDAGQPVLGKFEIYDEEEIERARRGIVILDVLSLADYRMVSKK
ncbi:hypothetical protein BGX28_001797 [Mortierella sp. GBA30]|nr:hypothetical protein BGX28_001797 [Mortierella sp. GBA30]